MTSTVLKQQRVPGWAGFPAPGCLYCPNDIQIYVKLTVVLLIIWSSCFWKSQLCLGGWEVATSQVDRLFTSLHHLDIWQIPKGNFSRAEFLRSLPTTFFHDLPHLEQWQLLVCSGKKLPNPPWPFFYRHSSRLLLQQIVLAPPSKTFRKWTLTTLQA